MTQQELDIIIKLAIDAIAQVAAERGVSATQVIADSTVIDDDVLKRALAFQVELATPATPSTPSITPIVEPVIKPSS